MFGRQRRAQRKRAEALEALRRPVDLAEALGSDSWPYPPRPRPRRRRVLPAAISTLALVVVVAVFIALHPSHEANQIRHLLGFGPERILPAPDLPPDTGSYTFLQMQPNGRGPVGYDPCIQIEVEVNPSGAPENHHDLVVTALERTSAATGLSFTLVGTTDREPDLESKDRSRRPVLVAWATEDEQPKLSGEVAGFAGSATSRSRSGNLYYTHGWVVLDIDVFDNPSVTQRQLQSIVDHEFGHLVGLGHVDDANELMHPTNSRETGFGPGDLRGLAELGRVPCE